MNAPPSVLDPRQLVRIESLHRGFLYRHLFAVGCLLQIGDAEARSIVVEADEDIEIRWPDGTLYIQVKTRSEQLHRSDVSDVLDRFKALREEHVNGTRSGDAHLLIISNAEPDPTLLADMSSADWQDDTFIRWPGSPMDGLASLRSGLPPAFDGVRGALTWCAERAAAVPSGSLPADALVFKLASIVQLACSGTPPYASHEFQAADVPALLGQVVLQLHAFPEAPDPYRPHEDEPALVTSDHVRLIVGLSGSGKTAWASQHATHSDGAVAYFDASGSTEGTFTRALARELAAKFLDEDRGAIATVLFTGASGSDSLRALSILAEQNQLNVVVVVDDAHEVSVGELRDAIAAAPSLRFVFLTQPSPTLSELEAVLGTQAVGLEGWGLATIAEECSSRGCRIDPRTSGRLRALTGGLPMFVRSAAAIVMNEYSGDTAGFCAAFESNEHFGGTAQEAILSSSLADCSEEAKTATAMLSLSTEPLERDEILGLLAEPLDLAPAAVASLLTDLRQRGVLVLLQDGRSMLHDAFRPLALAIRHSLDPNLIRRTATQLRTLLTQSIAERPDARRSLLIFRLLPITGDVRDLADLATDEFFYEWGLTDEFDAILDAFARDETQSAEDRFWALDGLAFARLRGTDIASAESYVDQMESLLPGVPEGVEGPSRVAFKRVSIEGLKGNASEARRIYAAAEKDCGDNHKLRRIVRYVFALALFHCGQFEECADVAWSLQAEYYGVLGLEPRDVFAQNVPEIVERLGDRAHDIDTIKHLADCLDLFAASKPERNAITVLSRIHAVKFYGIAHAMSSAIRVGQDVVEDILATLGDAEEARSFIEQTLLPTITQFNLLGHLVRVSSLHAVVLAYCGDFAAAHAKLDELRGYHDSLPELGQRELDGQMELVSLIEQGRMKLSPPPAAGIASGPRKAFPKVGRNQPCPCGSGRKYKRCHGR